MFEEALSLLSIWASMNSWLTPTVLFLFLNLMIATIAFTSGFTTTSKPPPHHPDNHQFHHHNHQFHHQQQQQPPPQIQTQLTRNPSVLQRLKSLNFYAYIHNPQPPVAASHSPPLEPQQPPLELEEPIEHQPPPLEPEFEPEVAVFEDDDGSEGPTIDEVYRLFVQKGNNTPHYGRQNSDTKPTAGEIPAKLPTKIKKSASHKSAFGHFKAVPETKKMEPTVEDAAAEGGGEVDAAADDFINRFKQQLKMQRLDSIVRYKDMITRGSGK